MTSNVPLPVGPVAVDIGIVNDGSISAVRTCVGDIDIIHGVEFMIINFGSLVTSTNGSPLVDFLTIICLDSIRLTVKSCEFITAATSSIVGVGF